MPTSIITLSKRHSKPIFQINHNKGVSLTCMLDTGADMPVWCSGKDFFEHLFPESQKKEGIFLLGGFGKGVSEVDVYVLSNFKLRDITYQDFHIAVLDKPRFSCDLILSYTALSQMDYSIINRNVNTPQLKIVYDREIYSMGVVYKKNHQLIERMYSFVMKEN